jgi:DnaK suppressor protein
LRLDWKLTTCYSGIWYVFGMSEIDREAVRRKLEARRAALRDRLSAMTRPPEKGAGIGFGKRIGDGTVEAVSRLTDFGVGRNLEASEGEIARALAKLDEDTYGLCDACGRPIAPRRLEAKPESVLCIECARRAR